MNSTTWRTWISLSVLSLIFGGCAATTSQATQSTSAPSEEAAPSANVDLSKVTGTALQPFSLRDHKGKAFAISKHLGKDVLMISFWATWCGPCKSELEAMVPIYDELAERGFVYIAISTDGPETVSEVADYVRTYDYQYPVLLDQKSTVLNRFNPRGDLPYYLLVNRRGEIVEQHQGFTLGDEVQIRHKVLSLLGGTAH